MVASLNNFATNLKQGAIADTFGVGLKRATDLLCQHIYPKLSRLGAMVTEPLHLNVTQKMSLNDLKGDLYIYRFNTGDDIFLIPFKTDNGYCIIYGKRDFDDSLELECYFFDQLCTLIELHHHHAAIFSIANDFGTIKKLSSRKGKYLFVTADKAAICTSSDNRYVHLPYTCEVLMVKDNLFMELKK